MMRDFKYFTLAPLIDESSQQYKFEGGIEASGSPSAVNLEYRFVYDLENEESGASDWQPYSIGDTITLTTDPWFGVQFRNDSGQFSTNFSNSYYIKSTYAFDAGGRIMSLINYMDESATLKDCVLVKLFLSTKIHDAHEIILPDRVSKNCYSNMFDGCTSLTAAPELQATTLANGCYSNMFNGCTSLTTAPELPATTLDYYCYQAMFKGCSSLTAAPQLPVTTLKIGCYSNMFDGCTSLTQAPALPATKMVVVCYQYMFDGCTSLTAAPELQATTLASNCYYYMFNGCSKIDHIVWKSTTSPSSKYCNNWLNGVSASGTFEYTDPTLDVSSITRDSSGVPAGWSISLRYPETKLLLKINNASVDSISLLGKKIASLSINGKKVKSSSGV